MVREVFREGFREVFFVCVKVFVRGVLRFLGCVSERVFLLHTCSDVCVGHNMAR